MINGLLGKKVGMTHIFDDDGNVTPVTAVEAGPCFILELMDSPIKVKLGFDSLKESRGKKPQLGYFKKIGVAPLRLIEEFGSKDNKDYKVGQEIKADLFQAGDYVNVTGVSIGKGFQGGMKLWHWRGGPRTHGSTSKRRVGSIGSSSSPSRVWKGHHMPGHMGDNRVTVQNLRVMQVDLENNLLLIKGAIPGSRNSYVTINKSFKKTFLALGHKKVAVKVSKDPMKQSKSSTKGKA